MLIIWNHVRCLLIMLYIFPSYSFICHLFTLSKHHADSTDIVVADSNTASGRFEILRKNRQPFLSVFLAAYHNIAIGIEKDSDLLFLIKVIVAQHTTRSPTCAGLTGAPTSHWFLPAAVGQSVPQVGPGWEQSTGPLAATVTRVQREAQRRRPGQQSTVTANGRGLPLRARSDLWLCDDSTRLRLMSSCLRQSGIPPSLYSSLLTSHPSYGIPG